MPSELEKLLAKRRGSEEIFENSTAPSTADVTSSLQRPVSAGRCEDSDEPPWLEGAVFVELPTGKQEHRASEEGLPPWFDAAVENGIVFYDPEGKEVVVPSSKVPAFKAALETVIEFEPVSASPAAEAEGTLSNVGRQACTDRCSRGDTVGQEGYPNEPPSAAASSEEAESKRQEIKTNLQKRYFDLLRSGLEPNEAAARAILEVAGHSGQEAKKAEDTRTKAGGGGSSRNSPASSNRSCASGMPGDFPAEGRSSTEIVVAA
jgi:hypothetical protein